MRRDDICLYLSPVDRAQLQALLTDRNTPRKVVWRAEIVLATADGRGTNEIMRRSNTSKPTAWRWQARHRRRRENPVGWLFLPSRGIAFCEQDPFDKYLAAGKE